MKEDDEPAAPTPEEAALADVAKAKRERRMGYATLGVIVGAVFFAFAPSAMLGRASKSDTLCSNTDYEDQPGASEGCAWKAHAWLALPKIVPWTRKEALATDRSITRSQASRALKRHSVITPDAKKRDEAAHAYLEECREPSGTVMGANGKTFSDDPQLTVVAVLSGSGAWEEAARAADVTRSPMNLQWAFESALATADLDRARAIAKLDPSGGPAFDFLLQTGAFLCLTGDVDGGRARIVQADVDYRQHIPYDDVDAQVALSLCGGTGTITESRGRSAVQAARLFAGKLDTLDRLPDVDRGPGDASLDVSELRTPFVAAWLATGKHAPRTVVDLVSPIVPSRMAAVSPWSLGALGSLSPLASATPMAFDPEKHEKAGEALLALAKEEEAASAEAKPVSAKDPAHPDDGFRPLDDVRRSREAIETGRKDVAKTLRDRAKVFFAEAAFMRAALRQRAETARDVSLSLDVEGDPFAALHAASLLVLVGDDAGAKKLRTEELRSFSEKGDGPAWADLLDATIAMKEKRWDDAHAAAKSAFGRKPESLLGPASWMLAATALKVGKPDESPGLSTPGIFERDKTTWEKLAGTPEPQRKELRMRMQGLDTGQWAGFALPAIFFVIGEAAKGTDPEAYIDAMIGINDRTYWTPFGMRARAEAARWRGDEETAKKWDARADKLFALVDRPDRVVLARLAGFY